MSDYIETIKQELIELNKCVEKLNKAISEIKEEKDPRIGKYCWFWDGDKKIKFPLIGVLAEIENNKYYLYYKDGLIFSSGYNNCELLPFQPDDIKAEEFINNLESFEVTGEGAMGWHFINRYKLCNILENGVEIKIRRKQG